MTREEAIKTLKENCCAMCAYASHDMDSCDIRGCDNRDAIKTLERESCEDNKYDEFGFFDPFSVKEKEPCDDCISRQAVIEVLNKMNRYVADDLTLCDTERKFPKNEVFIVDDVYEEIVEQLLPVNPAEKVWRWIPINEKMPEENQEFLAYSEIFGMIVTISKYVSLFKVKSWMPLPEKPYKTESEEKE